MSTKAVGLREFSSNAVAICPEKSLSTRNSRTITGGAVFYTPQPTLKPSTTNRIGRWHTKNAERRNPPGAGTFWLVWRPPEEATGGTHRTDDGKSDAAGGGGATNDTDGDEAKDTNRKRADCRGQGNRENQGGGKRGKREEREIRGGPEPPSDGKDSTLHFKGQSLGTDQANVRGNGKPTTL